MRFGIVKNQNGSSHDNPQESSSDTTRRSAPREIETENGAPADESDQGDSVSDYTKIQEVLGYTFVQIQWLQRALTHRSLQTKGTKNDYERLEFLGDAVLDLAVAQLLLDAYPEAREGELSKMRAALVNTFTLADVARALNIGPYIRLSRGEMASGGADRPSILADVVEAIMGAIYREGGYQNAFDCVSRLFGDRLRSVTPRDPKTELQEALHAAGNQPPVYQLECVEGPEHAPTFISIVSVDGEIVGRGRGNTKKASQQAAAEIALSQLQNGSAAPQQFMNVQQEGSPEVVASEESEG